MRNVLRFKRLYSPACQARQWNLTHSFRLTLQSGFFLIKSSGSQSCTCFNVLYSYDPTPCSGFVFAVYAHDAGAQVSNISRRSRLSHRQTSEDILFCPASLTPCRIEGSPTGYEVRLPISQSA